MTDTDDVNVAIQEGKPVSFVYPDADGVGTLVIPNAVLLVAGAEMRAEAKDRRLGGGVRALLEVDLTEQGPDQTEMMVSLESHVLGKVGEFGQPVMRKKTDAILQEFARQVSEQLAGE